MLIHDILASQRRSSALYVQNMSILAPLLHTYPSSSYIYSAHCGKLACEVHKVLPVTLVCRAYARMHLINALRCFTLDMS